MADNSPTKTQLDARIEALSLAFRALVATLPADQSHRLIAEIANRTETFLRHPEPVNETDPYALELRSHSVWLTQQGPEVSIYGADEKQPAQD
jgi:hypothetical protein